MKGNKKGSKRRNPLKTVKPALLLMAVLLIVVLVSVTAFAEEKGNGRSEMDAGAGTINYYQQEIGGSNGALGAVGSDGQTRYSYQVGDVIIKYNSGSGWSVGGYSVIARSTRKGVPRYNESDLFELDGEELVYVATDSDSYGSYYEFRTKRETFQQIKYYPSGTLGTHFWLVDRPDGSKAFYCERIVPTGGNSALHHNLPRAWAVSEVRDRGNYNVIYYKYLNDPEGGYYLQKVISGKVTATSSPYKYAVTVLTWADNTDYQKKYSFRTGSKVLIDGKILTKVEHFMGAAVGAPLNSSGDPEPGYLVEGCRVEYEANQVNNGVTRKRKPLIKKIIGYGTDRNNCRPPVTFSYTDINLEIAPETEKKVYTGLDDRELRASSAYDRITANVYGSYADFIDIDGDGLPDRLSQETNSGKLNVWLNRKNLFSLEHPAKSMDNAALRRTPLHNNTYVTTNDYFDINGDGLPDRIIKEGPSGKFKVRLNNGGDFGPETTWPGGKVTHGTYIRNHILQDTYADFIDMNGDGLIDQVFWDKGDITPFLEIYFNTGSGLKTTWTTWAPNLSAWRNYGFDQYRLRHIENVAENTANDGKGSNISGQLMDINGDGLPDYVVKRTALLHHNHEYDEADLEDHSKLIVCYNNGHGFEDPVQWNATDNACLTDMCEVGAIWISGDSWDYMDMNNDGLPDRVAKNILETIEYKNGEMEITHNHMPLLVWFNNGTGFDKRQTYIDTNLYMLRHDMLCTVSGIANDALYTGVFADFIDMNGDGFPDRVAKAPERVLIQSNKFATIIRELPHTNGELHVYLNKAETPPDLLKSIENGQGGKTTFTYEPLNKVLNPNCKPVMWVATSVKVSDGIDQTLETTYEYSNGVYDTIEKEFRGFGLVKVTSPTKERTETSYHIGEYQKGLPLKIRTYNYQNKLFDETEFVYDTVFTVFTGSGYNEKIRFIPLKKKTHKTYDGAEDYREVITEYKYDAFGNVTKTVVSESYNNDKRIVYNSYNIDRGKWNLRQLKETILVGYDLDRNFRLQDGTYNTYDSKGNLEAVYKWTENGISTYPVGSDGSITYPNGSDSRWVRNVKYYYNNYGNIIQAQDARGNSIYTTYDTRYQMFPVKTVNALGHTTWNYYDYYGSECDVNAISSHISLGRLTKTAFENTGFYSSQYYDTFGRVVKKVRMDYSESEPTEEIKYTDATIDATDGKISTPAAVEVKTRPLPGPEGPDNVILTTYTYSDGLGRTIQTKSSYDGVDFTTTDTTYAVNIYKAGSVVTTQYLTSTHEYTGRRTLYVKTITDSWLDSADGRKSQSKERNGSEITTADRLWVTTATDAKGYVTKSWKNGFGQILEVREPNYVFTTKYTYETGNGNLVAIEDADGNVTRLLYDTLGRKVKEDDPDLGTTTYTYDANGNLLSQTDAKGQTITYEYDVLNRRTKTTYPGTGNWDSFIYDNDNDPDFDEGYGAGRLVRSYISRNGSILEEQKFRYDQYGNIVYKYHSIGGLAKEMSYQYDGLGRIISATYPDGEEYAYKHDPTGYGIDNITRVSDSKEILKSVNYLPTGQISKMSIGFSLKINYEYWALHEVGAEMLKRLHTTWAGGSLDLNYSYDRNGNVLTINDANNPDHNQSFRYDELNRMFEADGNGLYGYTGYSYDQIGNMTYKEGKRLYYAKGAKPHAVKNAVSGGGSYLYKYDANGNLIEKRAYNEDVYEDNRFGIPNGVLTYDIYGVNKVVLNDRVKVLTATGEYGSVGSRREIELGVEGKTGTVIAPEKIYLRDRSSVYGDVVTTEPEDLIQQNNVQIMGHISYVFDTGDMLPGVSAMSINFSGAPNTYTTVESGKTATLAPGKYGHYIVHGNGTLNLTSGDYYFRSFRMESKSKLNLDETDGPIVIYIQGDFGMRAKLNHSKAGREGTANLLFYCVGSQDIFLGGDDPFNGSVIAPNAKIIGGQEQNKVFEGMFIGKEVNFHQGSIVTCVPFIELVPEIWTYKYDWNDRLIEVRHNDKIVMTSEYGINGERIRKSENGTDSYYFFPEYEEDWSGGTLTESAKYHFANGKRILKENEAGNWFYYVGDHLGSNTVVLDDYADVVKTMKYLPYGVTALESGTQDEDYRFNGKELDATGLYYYGARYYDPDLGRFITADTVTPGGGFAPQGLNRYSYCRNNPVKYIDPSGHFEISAMGDVFLEDRRDEVDTQSSGIEQGVGVGDDTLGLLQANWGKTNSEGAGDTERSAINFGVKYSNSFSSQLSGSNAMGIRGTAGFDRNVSKGESKYGPENSRFSATSASAGVGFVHVMPHYSGIKGNLFTANVMGTIKNILSGGEKTLSYGTGVNLSAYHLNLVNPIPSVGVSSGVGLDWTRLSSGGGPMLSTNFSLSGVIGFDNGMAMKGGFSHTIQEAPDLGSTSKFNYGAVNFNVSFTFPNQTGVHIGGSRNIYGHVPGAYDETQKPWSINFGFTVGGKLR